MNGYMLICKAANCCEWFRYASEADLAATRRGYEEYEIRVATKQQRLERQGGGIVGVDR